MFAETYTLIERVLKACTDETEIALTDGGEHADLASTVAFALAKKRHQAPKVIAEELAATNAELEEQTRALRDSESRLRDQQAELEEQNAQLETQTAQLEEQRDALARSRRDLANQAEELARVAFKGAQASPGAKTYMEWLARTFGFTSPF